MKDNNFSFIKLRDEIITKSGLTQNSTKEQQKRLKFEPNINVTRSYTPSETFEVPIPIKQETVVAVEPQQPQVMNANEISSRFSNKDSLNLIKKPIVKKDKKTIVISAESFLEPKVEEKKVKETKGEDLLFAINNLKLKDPNSYLPTTLPFTTNDQDTKTLDLNENDAYLFQFPRIIPTDLESQKKLKEEELESEEPTYDQHGYLIKNSFENSFKKLPKNSQIGKLKIYKSGKLKMQIGEIMYDVTAGINCKFAQELGVVFPKSQEAFFLGKIREKKLIVTPELNIK